VERYDVAIIGGGLVGASLACALAPLGLRVALLEAVSFRAAEQPSYDDRTLALSASSCRILEGLGIWPALESSATAIREVHVRELDRPGRVVLRPEELGLDRFGHVVEARVFGAAVLELLPGLESLDFLCPAAVESLSVGEDAATVGFVSDGSRRRIRASLVVGAEDHRGRAFECFTPTGPFAVMPHVNGRCGLIWCVPAGKTQSMMEMPESDFLRLAEQRFGRRLGSFVKMGRRSSYPLRLVRALEDYRTRAVILGNAAHAIHPIGAQGFNLGLRDVAVLAELLSDAMKQGADFGSDALLARYSEWRRVDQDGTVAYSDGLARVYSNPTGLAAAARTTGLLAHALVPALRRQLAVRAMGYRGRIPRLALGERL
jgi:2-octaprenyl-6-methoxyphenol hydroxylase